mgnify:CR=1 FL=1
MFFQNIMLMIFLPPENGAIIDHVCLVSLVSLSHVSALAILGGKVPDFGDGTQNMCAGAGLHYLKRVDCTSLSQLHAQ